MVQSNETSLKASPLRHHNINQIDMKKLAKVQENLQQLVGDK